MELDLRLPELIGWLKLRLDKLKDRVDDDYLERNLEALSRACDPETKPRLKSALENVGRTPNPRCR